MLLLALRDDDGERDLVGELRRRSVDERLHLELPRRAVRVSGVVTNDWEADDVRVERLFGGDRRGIGDVDPWGGGKAVVPGGRGANGDEAFRVRGDEAR